MKYYNRDDYERNLESYEVPEYFTKGARNDFVYSFIVGAVIGSAVGLVSLSKAKNKDKSVPKQDAQFKSNIIKQSEKEQQEAEQQVNSIKSTISEAQEKETEVSEAELTAQKVAIQQETSDNNLANMSPEAQEQQEAQTVESQAQANDIPAHIDSNAQPSESEVRAQQNAIQEEANIDEQTDKDNTTLNAAATSGGAIAATSLATAASNKKKALENDSQVSENTSQLLKETKPSTNKKTNTPNLVTKSDDEQSNQSEHNQGAKVGVVTASGLALAAKNKNKALTDDVTVAEKTALLLKPETPLQAKNKTVPNLVTPKKVDSAVESTTDKVEQTKDNKQEKSVKPDDAEQRVKQTHQSASFNDGIITHDNASGGLTSNHKAKSVSDSTTEQQADATNDGILNHDAVDTLKSAQQDESDQNNITENRPQTKKTEKAKSKIDKRTFND